MAARAWPGLLLALSVLGLVTSGCFRYARSQTFATSGTCAGACDHYVDCKESESESAREQCLEECQQIFVHKGEPDRASLQDFEELDCEATIAFVDGDSGHRSKADGRGVRRSQTQR